MTSFHIEVFGDKLFEEKIDFTQARIKNPRPAIRIIAGHIMKATAKRFEEEGPGWAPLTQAWEVRKAATGLDTRILRAHSHLFKSVTVPDADHQILAITNSSLVFGSTLPYAESMQKGYAGHNIPARPFLRITPVDATIIRNIFRDYFMAPWRVGVSKTKIPAFGGGTTLRGPGGRFIGVDD